MHPLIARFLDAGNALAALGKVAQAVALDADEAAFAEAARANGKAKAAVLKAKGKASPSPESQQALILLATEAATARVVADPALGPKAARALEALAAEGATPGEAHQLLVTAVLEEAFGYADVPDHFDAEYLAETLDSLVPLAKVTAEVVDEWLDAFAKQAEPAARALRLKVAETLLEAAWGEGPQPVSPEHVDDALEQLGDAVASSELERATTHLSAFVTFLAEKGVVGNQRAGRLLKLVASAALAGPETSTEEEDEGDDDEA